MLGELVSGTDWVPLLNIFYGSWATGREPYTLVQHHKLHRMQHSSRHLLRNCRSASDRENGITGSKCWPSIWNGDGQRTRPFYVYWKTISAFGIVADGNRRVMVRVSIVGSPLHQGIYQEMSQNAQCKSFHVSMWDNSSCRRGSVIDSILHCC